MRDVAGAAEDVALGAREGAREEIGDRGEERRALIADREEGRAVEGGEAGEVERERPLVLELVAPGPRVLRERAGMYPAPRAGALSRSPRRAPLARR